MSALYLLTYLLTYYGAERVRKLNEREREVAWAGADRWAGVTERGYSGERKFLPLCSRSAPAPLISSARLEPLYTTKFQTANFLWLCARRPIIGIFWTMYGIKIGKRLLLGPTRGIMACRYSIGLYCRSSEKAMFFLNFYFTFFLSFFVTLCRLAVSVTYSWVSTRDSVSIYNRRCISKTLNIGLFEKQSRWRHDCCMHECSIFSKYERIIIIIIMTF